jgi:hypothetical protein
MPIAGLGQFNGGGNNMFSQLTPRSMGLQSGAPFGSRSGVRSNIFNQLQQPESAPGAVGITNKKRQQRPYNNTPIGGNQGQNLEFNNILGNAQNLQALLAQFEPGKITGSLEGGTANAPGNQAQWSQLMKGLFGSPQITESLKQDQRPYHGQLAESNGPVAQLATTPAQPMAQAPVAPQTQSPPPTPTIPQPLMNNNTLSNILYWHWSPTSNQWMRHASPYNPYGTGPTRAPGARPAPLY